MKTLIFAAVLLTPAAAFSADCIDPDGDGWGWDGSNSCIVESTNSTTTGCNYSNAASNGGWGWDASTNSSCPPGTPLTPSEPETGLKGLAREIVGTWFCDEEYFYQGEWLVEKGTETFEGISVDMFTTEMTFHADGTIRAEQNRIQGSGDYVTEYTSTWAIDGLRMTMDGQPPYRIAFEVRGGVDIFSMYGSNVSRRSCSRL